MRLGAARPLALLAMLVVSACGDPTVEAPQPDAAGTSAPRRVSVYEVAPPYLGDTAAFWGRTDLFVMRPDSEPRDGWPNEVLFPSRHGVKIIVLLPGDYRGRSNGRLGPGVLYIEGSGTEAEPILVVFAPSHGADILATPHAAERYGKSEALLVAFRIWNQKHQYLHGLTFANGVSACLLQKTSGNVIDGCLWHETRPQPIRIRFEAHHNLVQRCVLRRFEKEAWGRGDTVAINLSDGACTHNHIVSNVILNYTDSYQHTDRDGEDDGLGAGTLIDNNFMGFTKEAYVQEPAGELLCGENAIDLKMGGTQAEPVRITNNVFFGVRAAKAGCAASGSGGYAVTFHRRGTWVELSNNLFVDVDSGIFLNAMFLDADPAQGRIDPHLTISQNVFSGVKSRATAFPARTGRVLSGPSAARFARNQILDSERLMEREPVPGTGTLRIENNVFHGTLDLQPREQSALEADGNIFEPAGRGVSTTLRIPWVGRTLVYQAPAGL